MRFSVDILQSDNEITSLILERIRDYLQKSFDKSKPNIAKELGKILKNALTSQPEYQSLSSGKLRKELGVTSIAIVKSIIDKWIDSTTIDSQKLKIMNNQIFGNFSINMIKSDYADVLSMADATIIDSNTGSKVPWLSWLLLGGGDMLVKNYAVQTVNPTARSRTGETIMIKSDKRNWRMPPEFAGVAGNNWVYRAMDTLDDKIEGMMQRELEKHI